MERLVKILDTMELLESYFNSRLAEGNELSIEESSCAAGTEYRELAAEAKAIMEAMEAMEATEEAETIEEVGTVEEFTNELFNVTENKELDQIIEMAVLSNKALDQMSDEEYRKYNLYNAQKHLKNWEARRARGNKTNLVKNMIIKYKKEVEKFK